MQIKKHLIDNYMIWPLHINVSLKVYQIYEKENAQIPGALFTNTD